MTRLNIQIDTGYSIKTGLVKMLKNVGVMFGLPALIYVLDNATELIPEDYWPIVLPIIAGASYLLKNWMENKGK